jgi:hypothetical protein
MSLVVDVYTHMYTHQWLELLRLHGGPDLEVKESLDSPNTVFYGGQVSVFSKIHILIINCESKIWITLELMWLS